MDRHGDVRLQDRVELELQGHFRRRAPAGIAGLQVLHLRLKTFHSIFPPRIFLCFVHHATAYPAFSHLQFEVASTYSCSAIDYPHFYALGT